MNIFKFFIIVLICISFVAYLLYPKNIQFDEAGGACFQDRCKGKIIGDCKGMTDNDKLNNKCKTVTIRTLAEIQIFV